MQLVTRWLLRVQLDTEWEQCVFAIRKDALATLVALLEDYPVEVRRAVLVRESDFNFAFSQAWEVCGQPAEYAN